MMSKKENIGQILIKKKMITADELEAILEQSKMLKQRIGQTAVTLGYVSESDIVECLSEHTGIPVINLSKLRVLPTVLSVLPKKFCQKNS